MADCSPKGWWHRCYVRTEDTVHREPAGFKLAVLFFVSFEIRNSFIFQHITFRPTFLHNLMTSECSRMHVFVLSDSAVALVALRLLQATTCQWTWRSHRRQGIPRLDEPLSASQQCLLQQSLLEIALFLHGAVAVFVCQPLGRTAWLHTTEKPSVGSNLHVNTPSWYNKPMWSAAWSAERCNLYRSVRELHGWYLHLHGFIVRWGVCKFHATETSLQHLCSYNH